MDDPTTREAPSPFAFNPAFAFWTLPFVMTQAWMTTFLKMGSWPTSPDKPRVEPAPATDEGQIPVPAPIREDSESEIFA